MDSAGWDARYGASELVWGERPNQFVVEQFRSLTPGTALDLACGEGRNSVWLAAAGWRVTAVDFSRVGLDKAGRLAEAGGVSVDRVHADLLDYRPPARRFDAVLVVYLHLAAAQRATVLARAAAAVAPGGMIMVLGHDATNLSDGVGGPQDPDVLYTPEGIASELAGLRVTRAERVRRTVVVDGDPRVAIDTLVTATRGRDGSAARG